MEKILGVVCAFFLAGCTLTNYSDIEKSEAVISNLKVEEVGKAGSKVHKLEVEFDYTIKDYKDAPNLYTCSVLFAISGARMVSITKGRNSCIIDSENGFVSILWDTPFSSRAGYRRKDLKEMKIPLKFHVAIHQKENSRANTIIGMSEALYLNPRI